MSRWREHSDVTRLNRALPGEPVVVAPLTRRVLRLALRLHRASAGLFDCAIAGTLAHLAIGGDGRVTKREPLAIDLGGIAKGEAVDQAVGALRRAGVRRALVNAGGDLRAFGRGEFRVVLRDPHDPDRRAAALCLNDAALASSSACYANAPGRSAIADPRNGQPVLMRHGVTVMAPRCALADALTKVVTMLIIRCLHGSGPRPGSFTDAHWSFCTGARRSRPPTHPIGRRTAPSSMGRARRHSSEPQASSRVRSDPRPVGGKRSGMALSAFCRCRRLRARSVPGALDPGDAESPWCYGDGLAHRDRRTDSRPRAARLACRSQPPGGCLAPGRCESARGERLGALLCGWRLAARSHQCPALGSGRCRRTHLLLASCAWSPHPPQSSRPHD